jgi:hypothetical protein
MDFCGLEISPGILGVPDVNKLLHRLLLPLYHFVRHPGAQENLQAAKGGGKSMILPRCSAETHFVFFRNFVGTQNSITFATVRLPSPLAFPHAAYGVTAGFRSVCPCHSHPHWQRTKSLNLSFFNRALQIAHDLIHIAVLQAATSQRKPLSLVRRLESPKSSQDSAQLSRNC